MKEIDFLPEWYKSDKRLESRYRTQYLLLGCLFAVMVAWNFASVHTLNRVEAVLQQQSDCQPMPTNLSESYARVKSEVLSFRGQAKEIGQLDSHIDVASVLGELSYLLDGSMVLREVEFSSEKFADKQKNGKRGSVVRAVGVGMNKAVAGGPVRFKIVIKGVASDGSEIARFVRKLEKSAYFRDITSSWRNGEIVDGAAGNSSGFEVSEFKIVCYLANYKERVAFSAKEVPGKILGS